MSKKEKSIGVADGIGFDPEGEIDDDIVTEGPSGKTSNRNYSKDYSPHPKTGKHGGELGRPAVAASERKIQFSVSCTQIQKEKYKTAADAEGRKLPDFINHALEEYIRNHNL